jgi:ribose transport system substrate-binding protein
MTRKWVTAALGAALLLSACGEADKGGDSGSQPAAVKKENLTVGISNLGLSFPFPAAISKGIKDKAGQLGVKVVEVDAQGKAEKQSNDVQDLIGQKPSGVLLLPVDSGVAAGLVDQLKAANIPTVAVASQVGDPKTRKITDVYPGLVALVTQAEVDAGRSAGELALKAVPKGGKLAVVEGAAGFAEVQLRFQDFLAPAKEAGVTFTVAARQPGRLGAGQGTVGLPEHARPQPRRRPVLRAERRHGGRLRQGRQGRRLEGGRRRASAARSSGIDAVKSGEVYGTVCYKPEDMGALAMQVLYDQLTGAKKRDGRVRHVRDSGHQQGERHRLQAAVVTPAR